ncbi:hypothetical protein [Chroococcus sp. FPU101]|uniref:hypothetical protein n=1 Tax=Chroococcus sp. FPU101 TaxID=1974212 RepID=UPI001A8F38F5|nr:hypothetical protein [Chroococcus sp. FPU101]GFE71215.1 unknown protein [Chroococcus sp. FPU101]
MPRVLMKNGEFREIPDEEMLSFLSENRDQIQDRYLPRKRRPLRAELSENTTSTK